MRPSRALILGAAAIQILCASFFLFDLFATIAGLDITLSWGLQEILEIAASLGLVLGIFLGFYAVRRSLAHSDAVENKLRAASGAFHELIDARFTEWALSPAEREVALYVVKGCNTQEIADLRNTSDGTVKAQLNAVYRKAGVRGRHQLACLFVDELLAPAEEH